MIELRSSTPLYQAELYRVDQDPLIALPNNIAQLLEIMDYQTGQYPKVEVSGTILTDETDYAHLYNPAVGNSYSVTGFLPNYDQMLSSPPFTTAVKFHSHPRNTLRYSSDDDNSYRDSLRYFERYMVWKRTLGISRERVSQLKVYDFIVTMKNGYAWRGTEVSISPILSNGELSLTRDYHPRTSAAETAD